MRETHKFLSNEEILEIKKYVPQVLSSIPHLIIDTDENENPISFMGIEGNKLEMLFITSECRGKGIGKKMLLYGIEKYGVNIITLADSNLFKNSKNYFDMIEKINDIFIENAKKTENYADLIENFEYLVDILLKYSKIVDNNACIKKLNEKHFERKHFFGKINNIAPKVEKLYKKIGLI